MYSHILLCLTKKIREGFKPSLLSEGSNFYGEFSKIFYLSVEPIPPALTTFIPLSSPSKRKGIIIP